MNLILKSMVSLLVLSNLAISASKDEMALDMQALSLQSGSRQIVNIEQAREEVLGIISRGGAPKRQGQAIVAALAALGMPADVSAVTGALVQGKNVIEMLGLAPLPQRQPVLALSPMVSAPEPTTGGGDRALRAARSFAVEKEEKVPVTTTAPLLALGWVDQVDQAVGVEEKRLALVGAQQLMLQSAEAAGRRQEIETRMATVTTALRAADDYYQTLLAMVAVMKGDLQNFEVRRLKQWATEHKDEAAETYVDGLLSYLADQRAAHSPVDFTDPAAGEQIAMLQQLLADARANVATAREQLEGITRDMLALQ